MTQERQQPNSPSADTGWLIRPVVWIGLVAFWGALSALSFSWHYQDLQTHAHTMAALRGRLVFQLVQTTRLWASEHGGVYAPISEKSPPNPWLDVPEKNIRTPSGIPLTKINPAYMTRQLAELLASESDMRIHLTSLNPINPDNGPDSWERAALKAFENGQDEVIETGKGPDGLVRYMAPLMVKKPCMVCHAKQGYQVGQVRGGLSVTMPSSYVLELIDQERGRLYKIHLFAFFTLSGLTLAGLVANRKRVLELVEERDKRRLAAEALSEKVAELERTRDELLQSEKMASLGRMVAGFSHEVNTPIGVAVGAASQIEHAAKSIDLLLNSDEVSEEELRSDLATIQEAAGMTLSNLRRAAGLVQSFKRTSVDQASDAPRSFNMAEIIEDVQYGLHNVFKRTSIALTVSCPDDLTLFGPAGAIEQIITNLMMNSFQHAFDEGQQAGEIHIQVEHSRGTVTLTYRDTGCGMTADTIQHIFEPFFTTRRGKGGSGLGLYLVYSLVTAVLKGTIHCESVPANGTTFIASFQIPESNVQGPDDETD